MKSIFLIKIYKQVITILFMLFLNNVILSYTYAGAIIDVHIKMRDVEH